jgi:2,3-bisphosphoglycerate-dependent phosphoglycerate mutase
MKNIYLVRHGESIANIDSTIYKTTADHAIPLSDLGFLQASEAGRQLCSIIPQDVESDKLRIWTSPYKRTRQTAAAMLAQLQIRFPGQVDIRENINLCEQHFGLFDGLTEEELKDKFPLEHHHYELAEKHEGKFWARMPLGESRFDVAVRVHQAFGTFHRDFEKRGIENIVVICHGVTLRAFAMQWLHLPYEWFENQPNPKNGAIFHIDVQEGDGKYVFQPEWKNYNFG